MNRYLITGGAGFIGSHLAHGLVARGDAVRVLDNLSSGRRDNLCDLEIGAVGSGAPVEWLQGDLLDRGDLERSLVGIRGVFHEAAQVSVPRSVAEPEASLELNAMGSLRLLEGMRRAGVEAIVSAASSAAYGNSEQLPKREELPVDPLSPYAIGKVTMEQMLRVWGELHGLRTVSLRYFNIFGPRQRDDSPYTGVIAIFARRLLDGLPITIHGDGGQTRDFTYVDNAVSANLLAMDAALLGKVAPGRVFNVGAGERTSVLELFEARARLAGSSATPEFSESRAGDVRDSFASLDRIRNELGYEPVVGFREGLERTLRWYRE